VRAGVYEYLATSFKAFTMPVVQSTARVSLFFFLVQCALITHPQNSINSFIHRGNSPPSSNNLLLSAGHLDVPQQDQTFLAGAWDQQINDCNVLQLLIEYKCIRFE